MPHITVHSAIDLLLLSSSLVFTLRKQGWCSSPSSTAHSELTELFEKFNFSFSHHPKMLIPVLSYRSCIASILMRFYTLVKLAFLVAYVAAVWLTQLPASCDERMKAANVIREASCCCSPDESTNRIAKERTATSCWSCWLRLLELT